MFRFFVNEKEGNAFVLSNETLKHIKVARVEKEAFICIYKEQFFKCKLNGNLAEIIEEIKEDHEFNGEVILAASFIDTKRFEWLIQKATELGATKLIPVVSNNVSKKLPHDIDKKLDRWNQIALNAAEQSFRNKPMVVAKPQNFNEVIKMNISNKFIAHEKENGIVKQSFPTNSLFLVGPEGGFTETEVKEANSNGFETVTLGKRILRAETASMFMLARVN